MTASPQDGRRRYPRARRITRGPEIRELFRRGKRSKTAHLDVFDSPSPASCSRVGLVVPRHKETAASRNRLKRRLREIARTEILPALESAGMAVDVLVRARREAYDASFEALERELREWIDRRLRRERPSG